MRITDLLALSHVPRWSNVRHSPPQSVADHTFRVAAIYLELCDRLGKSATLRGLTGVMLHDMAESYTGDIPGDFKREINGQLLEAEGRLGLDYGEQPLEAEKRIIKLADKIEGYTFIMINGLGSHAVRIIAIMRAGLIQLAADDWPTVRLLCNDITEETDRN